MIGKYRVWIAVPIEVSAYDEINAETEIMNQIGSDYLGAVLPILNSDKRRLAKMQKPLSDRTEIKVRGKWEPV